MENIKLKDILIKNLEEHINFVLEDTQVELNSLDQSQVQLKNFLLQQKHSHEIYMRFIEIIKLT